MESSILGTKPRRLRTEPARGIKAENPVDRKGGDKKAGIIRGVSVVTRGEALGHGMWLDREFLRQTADGINASPNGAKARFTHPGLSSDGLGSYLGRMKAAVIDGDVVRADLHFSDMAHESPDGDLAEYVMGLAEDDPESFGVSIVYMPDWGAEDAFEATHEDEKGRFRSPDVDNTDNLPHARLAQLRAADVVDDPAANPGGLFHRGQEIAAEADSLASFALGLTAAAPAVEQLELDPDRVRGFVHRFLESHGLQIVSVNKEPRAMAEDVKTDHDDETKPAEPVEEQPAGEPEPKPEEKPAAQPEPAAEEKPAEQQSAADPRAELKRYMSAFGAEQGATWYAEGIGYDEAQGRYVEQLQAKNAELEAKLAAIDRGEAEPAKFQAADKDKHNGAAKYAGKLPDGLAAYAASLRMAGAN